MLSQGFLNSPTCHNLVRRDLDLMQVCSVIIHHTDDVMIILETEAQARTDLNALVTHIANQIWLIHPAKVQRHPNGKILRTNLDKSNLGHSTSDPK